MDKASLIISGLVLVLAGAVPSRAQEAPDVVKDAPVNGAPAKDAPAKDAPAKDAPAKDAPAKDAPAKDAPAKDAPAKDAPVEDATDTTASDVVSVDAPRAPAAETHLLRYRLRPDERLTYRVEHLATVDTTIEGSNQKSQSRSTSTKLWRVEAQPQSDQFRFIHLIEDVEMWQEVTGHKPVVYNSRTDQVPPVEYEAVAAQLGKPLAEITIDTAGNVLQRKDHIQQPDLGFGGISVALPAEPIALGATWSSDSEVRARTESGQYKKIQIRQKYTLENVQTGIATISVRTEVLTPTHDARIRSQIIQRLSQGEIKFDIDAGHVIAKQLEWNETVLAFNGPDSNMKYMARFTETLIDEPYTAQRDQSKPE